MVGITSKCVAATTKLGISSTWVAVTTGLGSVAGTNVRS